MSDTRATFDSDDYEVIATDGGRFAVRIGRVRVELSRDELARLRQALADAASRFNILPWPVAQTDVAH